MTHLERATADQVQVRRRFISGGELAAKVAPGRAPRFYYQGKRVDAATFDRLAARG